MIAPIPLENSCCTYGASIGELGVCSECIAAGNRIVDDMPKPLVSDILEAMSVFDFTKARRFVREAIEQGRAVEREGDLYNKGVTRVEVDGVEVGQASTVLAGIPNRVVNWKRSGPLEIWPTHGK